jgi:hypothetical protein
LALNTVVFFPVLGLILSSSVRSLWSRFGAIGKLCFELVVCFHFALWCDFIHSRFINLYGRILVNEAGILEGDVFIVHSVSGRNSVPVDAALRARELGAYVICLTNVKYSKSVPSRHASHKRLFEVCDLVIDNCGDVGDAAVK